MRWDSMGMPKEIEKLNNLPALFTVTEQTHSSRFRSQKRPHAAAVNPEVPETLGSAPEGFNKRLKLQRVPERCLAEL